MSRSNRDGNEWLLIDGRLARGDGFFCEDLRDLAWIVCQVITPFPVLAILSSKSVAEPSPIATVDTVILAEAIVWARPSKSPAGIFHR